MSQSWGWGCVGGGTKNVGIVDLRSFLIVSLKFIITSRFTDTQWNKKQNFEKKVTPDMVAFCFAATPCGKFDVFT